MDFKRENIREEINQGKTFPGIEFGSTRIKAVLIDSENKPVCEGTYNRENRYEDGVWTYSPEGAKLIDPTGKLKAGIPLCPPEGDAGTGMAATDSIEVKTGNISAGTSIFAMVVLEKDLLKLHREIDTVTTPDGLPVAMVHCNNCSSEINSWVALFAEFYELMGQKPDMGGDIYSAF